MLNKFFSGEPSSKKTDFTIKREQSDKGEAGLLGGSSRKGFFFGATAPNPGIKITARHKKDLEALHLSALADGDANRFLEMGQKYTQMIEQLKPFFNDGIINKNTLIGKNIAIRNFLIFAYYNRGLAYAAQAKRRDALQDFDMVLNFDEKNQYALYQRGMIYSQQGKYKVAETDFKTIQNQSLLWHVDLNHWLCTQFLATPSRNALTDAPLNTLFFYEPNELHYVSYDGAQQIMTIRDPEFFFNQIPVLSQDGTVNTVILHELGVTLPYFPRFLIENAEMHIALMHYDWTTTKQKAEFILQAMSPPEQRTIQEINAAEELQIIATEATEGETPAMMTTLTRKPTHVSSQWRLPSSHVLPDMSQTIETKSARVSPVPAQPALIRPMNDYQPLPSADSKESSPRTMHHDDNPPLSPQDAGAQTKKWFWSTAPQKVSPLRVENKKSQEALTDDQDGIVRRFSSGSN